LQKQRQQIESNGTQLAFVYREPEQEAGPFFDKYDMSDVPRISDPDSSLYKAFFLPRVASMRQLFRPLGVMKGFITTILKGHGFGKTDLDELQMPGVFVIHDSQILRQYIYPDPWVHPDFLALSRS
jgi:hypothetical protein